MTEQPHSTFEREKNNVGEGWQKLIEFCHFYLTKLDPDYEVLQIKEKFGGLRYYAAFSGNLDPSDQAIGQGLTDMCEQLSFLICEECGEHGRIKSIGTWLRTLCDKHAEEALENRRKRYEELQRMSDERRKSAQSKPN